MTPYTQQTEIQFFWPLTEQMPLSLDYAGCDIPMFLRYSDACLTEGTGLTFVSNAPSWSTYINIDANNLTITSATIPPFYRRVLYKLLGINWKQK
jgi:hypothetical protein